MAMNKSILPLRSHPHFTDTECFSSKVNPQLSARLLAENDDTMNNGKMLVGLFMFDDNGNEWKHTGDVFEHVWTGDWAFWEREFYFLFSHDALVLYVATRDNNTLYALDTTDHLKVISKVDLPFRPKAYTLATTPLNSAVYITSNYPWIVSVYQARTLRLFGTAPSGRIDLDTLDDEDVAKIYNLSAPIAHRRIYLTGDSRDAVVIGTPELCCVSHELVCRLSSYVVLVDGGGSDNPRLLDLETLRTVIVDVGSSSMSVNFSKAIFRCKSHVVQRQLKKWLDEDGHLSADAPTFISII